MGFFLRFLVILHISEIFLFFIIKAKFYIFIQIFLIPL